MSILDHDLDCNVAGSLARNLSPTHFSGIVESFGQDLARLTDEMEAGMLAGDPRAVHSAAHGLAGAAASVGALALERAARRGLGKEPYPADLVVTVRTTGVEAIRALHALILRK